MTDPRDNEELSRKLVELTRDLLLIPSSVTRAEDRETCLNFIRNHLEEVEGVVIHEYRSEGYPSLAVRPNGIERPEVLLWVTSTWWGIRTWQLIPHGWKMAGCTARAPAT